MKKKPKNTPTFHYHNENPFGKKTGDCSYRAIGLATGYGWNKAVVTVALWMVKTGQTLSSGVEVDSCIKEFGNWVKHPMPKHPDGTRYTIEQLINEVKKEKNPVLVSCANHLTVIKGGKIWDTWDCGYKCVGNYWTLEG